MEQAENRPFIPLPPLAQSDFHRKAMGSSAKEGKVAEDLHRPSHEYLSTDELATYVQNEIAITRKAFLQYGGAKEKLEHWQLVRNDFLFANLNYLAAIGRLPKGISLEILEKELPQS